MGRKFGKFGESSAICQTKTNQSSSYNNNPLAGVFIRQTFSCQTFEKSKFAKHSPRQTFPLYSICIHKYVRVFSFHKSGYIHIFLNLMQCTGYTI